MAYVILKNVTKKYGKNIIAVNNLNLEIEDKEFFVLVGPSGSGKTTILRLITGLEKLTDGSIFIDNNRIDNLEPKDRNIAMVFQNFALYPHMTVFDNIGFSLKIRKFPKQEIIKRVLSASEILNITHLLNRKPKELSGGEKQRVAIGRAIVRHPKVFLFDEPLANLDVKLRNEMKIELKKLHSKLQTTIIYVTHDQTDAMILGNRIGVIKDGELQQIDTPINLYNAPKTKFVAEFIGWPQMNFFNVEVKTEYNTVYLLGDGIKIPIQKEKLINKLNSRNNKKIIVGIRAENIFIDTENPHTTGKIDIIEPVGSETYLTVLTKNDKFIIKSNRNYLQFKTDTEICLEFNIDKLHFFDSETLSAIDFS